MSDKSSYFSDEEISDNEAELALLRKIVDVMTPAQKKRIAKNLEKERVHFARTSTPGHLVWYPEKVAVCAVFERMTRK